MRRRDFTLAALAAPVVGLLGKKPAAQAQPSQMPPQQNKPRDKKTDTPLWTSLRERDDFVVNALRFSFCESHSFSTSVKSAPGQMSICEINLRYFDGQEEEFYIEYDEEIRYWYPQYAALEIEHRYHEAIKKLKAKVLGFKETT